jgi:hypothetical protein
MNVYAFDVDETLEISNGPVILEMMLEPREQGHAVGLCGNMNVFCKVPDWHRRISFLGQGYMPKHMFLHGIKANVQDAEDWVMVGNVFGATNSLGFVCGSHDSEEAMIAGWRFIKEDDFANGAR